MSDFTEMLAESSAEARDEVGEAVTFRGVEHTANVGTLAENPEFGIGGESSRKTCTIVLNIPGTPLDPEPRKGERIRTTSHGELEIIGLSFDSVSYNFTCSEIGAKR